MHGKKSGLLDSQDYKEPAADEEVNKKLLFEGWTVIRFWGKDIQKNLDECVKAIEEVIFEIKMEPEEIGWEDMKMRLGNEAALWYT